MMFLYRLLLLLYPSSFRHEYASELCAVFERKRRNASGSMDRCSLWLGAIIDVLTNATAEHFDILRQDLKYTIRSLRRSPGFTITATVVVALGVGANTAVYSVTDFVLIRPLPFHDPDRLVKLWHRSNGYPRYELSPGNYRDWKRHSTSFESSGVFNVIAMNMVGQGDPLRVEGAAVSSDLFPTLGVKPLLGRLFTEEEDRYGANGTVILGYSLWKVAFGGDAGVIGRTIRLDDTPYQVIGVMGPEIQFPNREAQIWTATRFAPDAYENRDNTYLQCVARLRPGVTVEQAKSELDGIAAGLERQFPKENEGVRANVLRIRDELSQQSRMLLMALSAAALCVLLIACSNLTSLQLARAIARQKELAVRTAIGAGRERLTRQRLTEGLVLCALGGAAGLLVAWAAVPLLYTLVPNALPLGSKPGLDRRVLAFAIGLTCLVALAISVIPTLRMGRECIFDQLRDNARSGGLRRERVRSILVVVEVLASVVLLVCSGLLIRALWRVQSTDPGFRSEHVLTMRTALPWPKYQATEARNRFYDQVLGDIRALPGVTNAAYISFLPMGVMRGGIWPATVEGQNDTPGAARSVSIRFITPGFFDTLSIPVLKGRDVSLSDRADQPFVAVVSESFARRHWPGQDPIGRKFNVALSDRTIVGVVADIRVRGLERESEPQIYLPSRQVRDGALIFYPPKDLVVHAKADVASLLPAIRQIIGKADPQQPISNVSLLSDVVRNDTQSRAVQVKVLGAFAAIALLLAAVGIHGLLSFMVSQRTQEIGVRMALGAQTSDILRMILRQGARLALAGVLIGAAVAFIAARAMESLLFGIKPLDLLTFSCAVVLCGVMTLLGSAAPAIRAMRVDPLTAIRTE